MWISGQLHTPADLPPRMNPGTHGTGGWAEPTACLDDFEKTKSLVPAGIRSPDRHVRRERIVLRYGILRPASTI